ncbi:RNA recognition motif 2-domain-containing protein [Thamnidium elegans]|nr:RNA recognition motif 2-domain-containing protein [Thamnidium elegans]
MPTKDRTLKDKPLKGQPLQDQTLKDQPWKDQPSKNQLSKNRSSKDRSLKGKPSRDRPSKDRPSKDISSKDRLSKDRSSKVKPVNHQQSNELDLKKIASGENKNTTFMIRNIPNKYTQKMLIESLDKTHASTYDFLYLRMDFKNKCNVGYAFINFIDPKSVVSFAEQRDGKNWELFKSTKRCSLSYATIQGKEALVRKFKSSPVMDEDESFQPKLFYSSGPNKGKEQPFFKKPPQHARSRNNKCYHKH